MTRFRLLTCIPAAVMLASVLASCASRPVREEYSSDDLLRRLESYNRSVHSVQGEATAIFRDGDEMSTFRLSISTRWPSMDLRLDIRDYVFKKQILTLVKRGEDVFILNHLKKEYTFLTVGELDFEKLSGLPLRKEIFIPTLIGRVPVAEYESFDAPAPDTLVMRAEGRTCTVRFDSELAYPVKVEYEFSGEVYDVTFSKYRTHPDDSSRFFPHYILLEHGEKRLELSYSTLDLNSSLDDGLFQVAASEYSGYDPVDYGAVR
jgi:hypothetical protein